LSNLLLRDEISSLKAEARPYCKEVTSLNRRLQTLESQALQDTPALIVGREVRLRYLERHLQRMGHTIGKQGYERIKAGGRAAHRGRPMVDAMLCLTELMRDREAYRDLYAVTPKEMQETVVITGFRASLQSKGRITDKL
jgi:hypothetical protein